MSKIVRTNQFLGIFLGIGVTVVSGYFVWIVLTRLVSFLENANPSVSAAVVGAASTLLVGVSGALYTQAQIQKRGIEEAHRSKKVEIYKDFLEVIGNVVASHNSNVLPETLTEQELIKFMIKFKTNVILWGDPKVINAYLEFEKTSKSGGSIIFSIDNLYKAIREDIGLSNRGLDKYQLIKMYLKDPSELDSLDDSSKFSKRKS